MKGQLTIYDIPKDKPKPCDYKFQRYIGQKVKFVGKYSRNRDLTGHIVEIFPYYTYVQTVKDVLVGTPYDLTDKVEVTTRTRFLFITWLRSQRALGSAIR